MPRRPREQEPGGLYHVIARGNRKAPIVVDDRDRTFYLVQFGKAVQRFRWECLSYCFMPNHIHWFVRLREPNLARGMHQVQSLYANAFNARHGGSGHVFQARYWSHRVKDDRHLLTLLGYIAQNPVKAGLCATAEEYRWSSHAAILGLCEPPPFLAIDALFELLAETPEAARARYAELVAMRAATVA